MAAKRTIYPIFTIQPRSGIVTEDCTLLRMALHRHSDLFRTTGTHRHPHHQILFYLRGLGKIRAVAAAHEVRAGTAILLPAGTEHQFVRHSRRNPLCLVLDFLCPAPLQMEWQHPVEFRISEIRELVNRVTHLREVQTSEGRLQRDGLLLQILAALLTMFHDQSKTEGAHPKNLLHKVQHFLEKDGTLSLDEAARLSGLQRDYLNRLLKLQGGMTFGQLRAAMRLVRARKALMKSKSVTLAAHEAGFDDVNYFIRWFRRQTGRTPGTLHRERLNRPKP